MLRFLPIVFLLGLNLAARSSLAADDLIVKSSANSVAVTIERLQAVVASKGLKVFGLVDHAGGARAAGLKMAPSQVLMFGSPKLGTPLMQTNPRIGAALPIKVLVWQDKAGKTQIGYKDPAALKRIYDIKGRDKIFATMKRALAAFTDHAAKPAE
jgi:uncharacterized protein (DUF302 family)